MALQDGEVDQIQGLLRRKRDVKNTEEGGESRVNFIPTSSSFAHGSNKTQVPKKFNVHLFATIVHETFLQQQLQQGNGLLCAILINLQETQESGYIKAQYNSSPITALLWEYWVPYSGEHYRDQGTFWKALALIVNTHPNVSFPLK